MTANTPGNRSAQSDSFAVVSYDHCAASSAYDLYAALQRCLRDFPQLNEDELFHVFRSEAFERFNRAFGGAE